MPCEHTTFQRPAPTCPHCAHELDTDEMMYGAPTCKIDLFALAPEEGITTVECPRCDMQYAVKGGYVPHYTSAFAEEQL